MEWAGEAMDDWLPIVRYRRFMTVGSSSLALPIQQIQNISSQCFKISSNKLINAFSWLFRSKRLCRKNNPAKNNQLLQQLLRYFLTEWREYGSFMTYAHVGDSRIYLLRGEQPLQRLTVDDGYFPFALRKGWLKEEDLARIEQATSSTDLSETDLKHFERRNKITRALGWEEFQVAHTSTIDLVSGDRILLCTDGIHDNLTDDEIEELLRKGPVATSAQQLVQVACERSQEQQRRSKPDDMSAIIVFYQDC